MPKLEDILSKLNGAKYFSFLDLWTGYHHIPLDKSSFPKMAVNSPFGKYEYIKVPFGLRQTPAYFQELMTGILQDFDFAIVYLYDIIIFSTAVEERLSHMKHISEELHTTKLSMKFNKCHFFTKEIQYLGHIFSTKGIWPLPSKTQAIQNMYPPKKHKQVHAFLGLVGYYRKFVKNFAKIAKPLILLTCQQVKPAFNTSSQTHQHLSLDISTSQPDVAPEVSAATDPTPKSLTVDRWQALLQMQKLVLSANEYPNAYHMEKHLSMKMISSYM